MSDVENDLRATSDDLGADARRLEELEEEKRRLDPKDPRMKTLSAEAERLARRIVVKAAAEKELVDEAATE